MASIPQGSSTQLNAADTGNNTVPLIIVTILFFMWGLLTSLNDVLIPHLKSVYTLSYTQAMLVQFCFFGAYFVVSLPAGALIKRLGYQNGAVAGLVIAASGCALFYPAATSGYALFLLALFVLASGITILQVAANPYVTVLGPARTASSRLTLTQAFNSLGTTIAPALGGMLILGTAVLTADQLALLPAAEQAAHRAQEAASVQGPYLALAAALLSLALFFAFAKLPKIQHDDEPSLSTDTASNKESALSHTHLVLGAIGIFLYVGAEVSIGSFLINFFGEENIAGLKEADAAHLVMLEVAAMACRHAGYDPFQLGERNTGVYVGHSGGSTLAGEVAFSAYADEIAQFIREDATFAKLPRDTQEAVVRNIIARIHREKASRRPDGHARPGKGGRRQNPAHCDRYGFERERLPA